MIVRVKVNNEVYAVEVGDLSARPVIVKVEGETFEVFPDVSADQPQQPVSAPEAAPAPDVISAAQAEADCAPVTPPGADTKKTVEAPIPGVIVSLSVKQGDNVAAGQELCVLEAMKMKNIIRATRSGLVKTIYVSKGDSVSHGQALMEYEN